MTEIKKDGNKFYVDVDIQLEDIIHFITLAKEETNPELVRKRIIQAELAAKCMLAVVNG